MEDLNEFVDTRVMQKKESNRDQKKLLLHSLVDDRWVDKTSSKEEAKNPLISWEIIWNKQNTKKACKKI